MFEGRSRKKRGGLVVNARCMTITECVYDLDGSCMNEVAEKQDTQTLNCCKAYFSVNWHPLRPSWSAVRKDGILDTAIGSVTEV
jgi:hypothetical protein